jgi:hypothetical protein
MLPLMETPNRPRPNQPDKVGPSSDPSHPQPKTAEVESARLFANQAREELRRDGLNDREIDRLADEYIALDIAEDVGEDVGEFIAWARKHHSST